MDWLAAEDWGPGKKEVSRQDYGDEWPLTVGSGVLACAASAVTFETDTNVYALNGIAKARKSGAELNPTWAEDTGIPGLGAIPGLKKSIGPLIDDGLKLCGE